ncbi:MAG: hypothetical protein EU531_03600 [Promethearchaeota archaeon]|nr:MAG: hypothetical protein EU531_03600 [Candidatus Lokiarchaeota archaeon]
MSLEKLKTQYSSMRSSKESHKMGLKSQKELFPSGGGPQDDFLYSFLALIYEGYTHLSEIKTQMRDIFTTTMRQLIITEENVDEYLNIALSKNLVKNAQDSTLSLTKEGKIYVESCYLAIQHESYWLKKFLSEKAVMTITAIFLIILSILKITTGLQISSQGMITDGFENLTDLIKVGIIVIVSLELKKDKLASIIILIMMLFTGISLIWSNIEALLFPSIIIPTIQGYFIVVLSILFNLGLMFLKGLVGKTSGNLSLISDSKDSKLNMLISTGVMVGLTFAIFNIYFIDAIIAIIIAIIVSKEGVEILVEILKKREEFDLSMVKIFADTLYDNKITGYLIASINREPLNKETLLKKFEDGLNLGRKYYNGFADFFYKDLEGKVAGKYLDTLIEGGYIKISKNKLDLTTKGYDNYIKLKKLERFTHTKHLNKGASKKIYGIITSAICITILTLMIIFGPTLIETLNVWLASF